jgi:hypothetical protein
MHSRVSGRTSKQWVWRGLLVCLSGIFFFAVVLGIYAVHLRSSAQTLIASAKQIRSATEAEDQIAMWRRRFAGKYSEEPEGNGNRVYEVRLDNRLLYWLHLVPPTQLAVSIEMREKSLRGLFVVMTTESNGSASAWVQETFVGATRSRDPEELYVDARRDGSGRPWKTTVELTSQVAPAEKEKAFAIEATCLVRIGGCRDAAEILPSVWH